MVFKTLIGAKSLVSNKVVRFCLSEDIFFNAILLQWRLLAGPGHLGFRLFFSRWGVRSDMAWKKTYKKYTALTAKSDKSRPNTPNNEWRVSNQPPPLLKKNTLITIVKKE